MDNIKVSLSILLPGSTMYSEQECSKHLTKVKRDSNGKPVHSKGKPVYETVKVPDFDKHEREQISYSENGKRIKKEILIRACKPAKQVINISEDAYNQMISEKNIPYELRKMWTSMSKKQKIKWHCLQIATSLGGKLLDFQIID